MVEFYTQMEIRVVLPDVDLIVAQTTATGDLVEVHHVVHQQFLQTKYVEFQAKWHLVIWQFKVTNSLISFKSYQYGLE